MIMMIVVRPLLSFAIIELNCSERHYLAAWNPNLLPNFDEPLTVPRFQKAAQELGKLK